MSVLRESWDWSRKNEGGAGLPLRPSAVPKNPRNAGHQLQLGWQKFSSYLTAKGTVVKGNSQPYLRLEADTENTFFKGKKEDAPDEQLIHAANGWAVNRQFSKEDSQMARTYVSRCLTPGKSKQNYSEIPSHLSMAKANKTKSSKHWWGCWMKGTIRTADGSVHRHSHCANP